MKIMAVRRPSDDDGNFIAWLQANLASLNRIAERLEERTEDLHTLIQLNEFRKEKLEENAAKADRQLELAHEQTRTLVEEVSRIDRRRAKDSAALAKTLAKIDGRVRRLEPKPKKKSPKKKRK